MNKKLKCNELEMKVKEYTCSRVEKSVIGDVKFA